MTTAKHTVFERVSNIGKTATAPMIEFPKVAFKVTEQAMKKEFANASELFKNGKQHLKAVPSIRTFDDVTTFATEAGNNMITFAKQTLDVAKESHLEYKSWLMKNTSTLKEMIKNKGVVQKARKRASTKAKAAPKKDAA